MAAEDYVGPPGHEKKLHKTHFGAVSLKKRTHPKDDPQWEYIGVGRWRKRKVEKNGKNKSGRGTQNNLGSGDSE